MNIVFRTPANGNFWLVSGGSLVHLATADDVEAAKKVAKVCSFTQDQLNEKNFTNALKAPGAYLLRGTPSNNCRLIGGGYAVAMRPGGNVKTLQAAGVKLVAISDKGLTAAWKDIK